MRIDRYRQTRIGVRFEVGATITWEDSDRPPLELVYAAEGEAAASVLPSGDVFLLAAALPAIRHGERRLALEGTVCPRLRDGVAAAAAVIASWYGEARELPAIEPAGGFRPGIPGEPRSACFLSGGVDSVEVLVRNREQFPPDHPGSIREALHVSGFPFRHDPRSEAFRNLRERAERAASRMAAALAAPLTRIESNLFEIESSFEFSGREYYSAAYASMAHLFSSRWTSIVLASFEQMGVSLAPLGSHPLLDPLYSSAALAFDHDTRGGRRVSRVEAIARAGLASTLLVCHEAPFPEGVENCGRCEKCLRTMGELAAVGALGTGGAFPLDAFTPGTIETLPVTGETEIFWIPIAEGLRRAGRNALADAALRYVGRARAAHRWAADRGWKGNLRRLDRRLLGGRLLRARRALSGAKAEP